MATAATAPLCLEKDTSFFHQSQTRQTKYFPLVFEAAVKSVASSQQENVRIHFLAQQRTPKKESQNEQNTLFFFLPVPGGCQSPVHARAAVVAAAVEAVAKKVAQNHSSGGLYSAVSLKSNQKTLQLLNKKKASHSCWRCVPTAGSSAHMTPTRSSVSTMGARMRGTCVYLRNHCQKKAETFPAKSTCR